MYRRLIVPLIVAVLLAVAAPRSLAVDAEAAADEQALQSAGLKTDGPALLAYLRKLSTFKVDAAKIAGLIKQLGDADYGMREKAVAALVEVGPPALPALKEALKSTDKEVVVRADRCLKALDKADAVPQAALRQLARQKPPGVAAALLAYLPAAPNEAVAEEVRAALARVALRGGTLDKALAAALDDNHADVRASAVEVMARKGGQGQVPALRKLLKDADPKVRLRTATALAELREVEAVPVLMALVGELPTESAAQAEVSLRELAGVLAPAADLGTDQAAHKKCQAAWDAWWRGLDDKAMLDRLRSATLTEALREKVQGFVKQLSDEDFEVREKASAGLVEAGSAAVPLLLQAAKNADAEVVRRAEACLQQIDKEPGKSNPATTCRLIALRKPAGAAAILLAYRPFAHDDQSAEEIQAALNTVGHRDGKPEQALLDALADVKVPVRRAAAAAALAQAEAGRQLPDVRKCLQDKDPLVRMPVALALAKLRDREAVAALIDGLAEVAPEYLAPTEDLLFRLADNQPPANSPGKDQAERVKYRDAWSAWWKAQGPGIDLARLDEVPRQLGYTLLVIPANGRVAEIGRDGKTRWELNGLAYPFDAQVLANGHVLVAEFHGRKVTERTLDNKVVWEKAVTWPIACQRLPNGNTFIATRNQLLEVNREGKEVVTINRPGHDLLAAQRLKNGEIACVLNSQRFIRLDNAGKETKGFGIGQVHNYVQFDVLPNGNVVIPQQGSNKVVEFDRDGKSVWEAPTNFPFAAMRLPNGRTLVTSLNQNQIVELDRAGKVVWQQQIAGPSWRARRR